MADGYLFGAAKRTVVMQALQAAAAAVFRGTCNRSSCRVLSFLALLALFGLFTHGRMLRTVCRKIRIEG